MEKYQTLKKVQPGRKSEKNKDQSKVDNSSSQKKDFAQLSKRKHHQPPSFHPPPHLDHHFPPPPLPPVYLHPILSILPMFLVLGPLLFLCLRGITSDSSSTVYLNNHNNLTVTINSSSLSTSDSASSVSSSRNTTFFLPVLIYPNGTLVNATVAIPFFPSLGNLFNLGGFIIGRSLSVPGNFFDMIGNLFA